MPSYQLMQESDADVSGEANLRPRRLVGDAVYVLQRQVMSLKQQSCGPAAGLTEEQIANDPTADLIYESDRAQYENHGPTHQNHAI